MAHFGYTWMTKRQSLTISKETIKLHDANSLHVPVLLITHVGPTWFRVDQANDYDGIPDIGRCAILFTCFILIQMK